MAAVANFAYPAPAAHRPELDMPEDAHPGHEPLDSFGLEDGVCPTCKLSVVSDQGGLVVAFGNSYFHVDCFKCAKCGDKVTADTNLLLLSDGSPICAKCSYSCNVCHLPILDEAIMTGDDSYHAHCFKCKVCRKRIDELVFAKTSQGIYCMDCHNERMIRIRKHNEKKAAAAAAAGSSSSKRKDQDPNKVTPSPSRSAFPDTPRSAKQSSINLDSSASPSPQLTTPSSSVDSNSSTASTTVFRPPPRESSWTASEQARKQNTIPAPSLAPPPSAEDVRSSRRRSYDDGTRPLDILFKGGLGPPESSTSVRDKRRSINPALSLAAANDLSQYSSYSQTSSQVDLTSNGSAGSLHSASDHDGTSSRKMSAGSDLAQQDHTITKSSQPLSSSDSLSSSRARGGSVNGTASSKDSSSIYATPSGSGSRRSSLQKQHINGVQRSNSNKSSRADVPFEIDNEVEATRHSFDSSNPPSPPPKEEKFSRFSGVPPDSPTDTQESSDDMSESCQVDNTTHTFIAPALPPIRISMTSGDFSELLSSVNGTSAPSKSSLPRVAELAQTAGEGEGTYTPPLSARSFMTDGSTRTSTSDTTIITHAPPSIAETDESQGSDGQTLTGSMEDAPQTPASKVANVPGVMLTPPPTSRHPPASANLVYTRLAQALADAKERGAQQLKLERTFVEAILNTMETEQKELSEMKSKFDGVKRASKQYIDGLSVAHSEYDRELKARRESEAEVTRLRVLLSGQAARLSALTGDSRKTEIRQQKTKELHDNLSGLERDLSNLRVQRDMAIAEVEELSAQKSEVDETPEQPASKLSRTLTTRLDKLKAQYERELVPLTEEREALAREILELKAARDVFLEETTVLNARNEELAQLGSQYVRRMDTVPEISVKPAEPATPQRQPPPASLGVPVPYIRPESMVDDVMIIDQRMKLRLESETPTPKKFNLWGRKDTQAAPPATPEKSKNQNQNQHNFQHLSILRLTRCDQCGDKMWGSQLRCSGCHMSVHTRCINNVPLFCNQQHAAKEDTGPLPPSMFGRDLTEQVQADARGSPDRQVPLIVEKCVEAVEATGLQYEGIYRKTGGTAQSRMITQLFERGDYNFDLLDSDRFNDICSITSVLKSYFRSLPIPLLTYELHDHFMSAVENKDPETKNRNMLELVYKLPNEHYCTLRMLMMHLNNVFKFSDVNLMTARNLGVVFGPTLMRSPNPNAEFSDMAGKALSVEWLVENAPQVFIRETLN